MVWLTPPCSLGIGWFRATCAGRVRPASPSATDVVAVPSARDDRSRLRGATALAAAGLAPASSTQHRLSSAEGRLSGRTMLRCYGPEATGAARCSTPPIAPTQRADDRGLVRAGIRCGAQRGCCCNDDPAGPVQANIRCGPARTRAALSTTCQQPESQSPGDTSLATLRGGFRREPQQLRPERASGQLDFLDCGPTDEPDLDDLRAGSGHGLVEVLDRSQQIVVVAKQDVADLQPRCLRGRPIEDHRDEQTFG